MSPEALAAAAELEIGEVGAQKYCNEGNFWRPYSRPCPGTCRAAQTQGTQRTEMPLPQPLGRAEKSFSP